MSVTSATDPVATIIDLLDNAADSDWTSSSPPDRIERKENSEPSERLRNSRLADVSLYVWSSATGEFVKWSAEGDTDQTEVVRVEILTNDDTTTNDYAGDVIDILRTYVNDNEDQTGWVDIWPDSIDDSTSQGYYRSAFAPLDVVIELRGHDDPP